MHEIRFNGNSKLDIGVNVTWLSLRINLDIDCDLSNEMLLTCDKLQPPCYPKVEKLKKMNQ